MLTKVNVQKATWAKVTGALEDLTAGLLSSPLPPCKPAPSQRPRLAVRPLPQIAVLTSL